LDRSPPIGSTLSRHELNPDVYFIAYVPFSNRPGNVAISGASALVIAFCATIYPAFKAARLHPSRRSVMNEPVLRA